MQYLNRIILILLIIFIGNNVFAKPKIVTSITPLAGIVAMLTKGAAEVKSVNIVAGCPHHYQLRPSDRQKIIDSDMFIYIDESFDSFILKLIENYQGHKIKISDIATVNFTINEKINWHFWLDLDNVIAAHEYLAIILSKNFPKIKEQIAENLSIAKSKIKAMAKRKQDELKNIKQVVLFNYSLEPFFYEMDLQFDKFYQFSYSSLREIDRLEKTLSSKKDQCLAVDINNNFNLEEKYNHKVIRLDSENWQFNQNTAQIEDLFYIKYNQMIDILKGCHN